MTLSLDLPAVAAGLAACYDGLSAPGAARSVRSSTSEAPKAITATPCVVVWPESGDITVGDGRMSGEHEFTAVLYLDQREADPARSTRAEQAWVAPMLGATLGRSALGLAPLVVKALPVRYQLGVTSYAGQEHPSVSVTVRVWTRHPAAMTP